MRLTRYINNIEESRASSMKYDKVLFNLLKNYSDMLKYYQDTYGGTLFMRGAKSSFDYGIIKPSNFNRVSAYTANYYTLITSEDPSWAKVPARSKSVVGATDYTKAKGYGNKLYVLVPENGSLIGQSQSEDFWGTFQHAFGGSNYPLGLFNKELTKIFEYILDINHLNLEPDGSLSNLKRICGLTDDFIDGDIDGFFNKIGDDDYISNEDVIKEFYKGDFYKMLLDIFDPDAGKIKVVKAGEPLRPDVEIWTTGDCLLVAHDIFKVVLDDMVDISQGSHEFKNTQLRDQLMNIKVVTNWKRETIIKKRDEENY